jgi:hypothetical protein
VPQLDRQCCDARVAHPEAQRPPPGALGDRVQLADDERAAAVGLDDFPIHDAVSIVEWLSRD